MSVRASTMDSLANHNGQCHKIDVSHHDNALQDGHTGDWTQGLPHAKWMWYHYTMCPWRKFMEWLHMVKKATPAEKQMKIVLNSKLKTIVYLSRSWLPIRNKRFFGRACANKQTQSISGLTNWNHFCLYAWFTMDTLGIEPRAFRMRSGCDTTTPCALDDEFGNAIGM